MSRQFSLAGLLRLRHLQQDEAAGQLASANARLDSTSVQRNRARAALGATRSDISSTESLYAMAAGRASMRSMLADLDSMLVQQRAETEQATAAYGTARAKAVALEKLEAKHLETVMVEELRAEQTVIDEIASTAWHADREGTRS
ncbi:flagellar export protein FliJ [Parafrigoribacterium soli]|uniref:flagellar export protein FliJ n=1 Tax=Parafrigoribacterium soli TaxID=3144663 RepID=UPI0032ECAD15